MSGWVAGFERLREAMGRSTRIDRFLYGIFGVDVEASTHDRSLTIFRSLSLGCTFETYLIRLHALSWVVFVASGVFVFYRLPPALDPILDSTFATFFDKTGFEPWLVLPGWYALLALGAGAFGKFLTRRLATFTLAFLARRRRIRIERTLPGAVRYLHVIATGSTDPEVLFDGVVSHPEIHGETATCFEQILARAELNGSIDAAIRSVARETPSNDRLAPFLHGFVASKRDGPDALRSFLEHESRLLAIQDEQAHYREGRYLSRVVVIFVLLLVLPLVLVLGAIATSIAIPPVGPDSLPIPEWVRMTESLAWTGIALILFLGIVAAGLSYRLRPTGYRWARAQPARHPRDVLRNVGINPANTSVVLAPLVLGAVVLAIQAGVSIQNALLLGYAGFGVPVGLVDARLARRRAALDRHIPMFVHELANRLDDGDPFRAAVQRVVTERDFGPLQHHVENLAFDLEIGLPDRPVRKRALERFVTRLGTPFAGRTIGLAIGALEAGSSTQRAFQALQVETGRLEHAETARRSRLPIVIAIGWTVALLIVSIIVVLDVLLVEVLDPAGSLPIRGVTLDTTVSGARAAQPHVYLLTQSAMLSSGWFAGLAGRGLFEAMLHSGGLVTLTFLVFTMTGLR